MNHGTSHGTRCAPAVLLGVCLALGGCAVSLTPPDPAAPDVVAVDGGMALDAGRADVGAPDVQHPDVAVVDVVVPTHPRLIAPQTTATVTTHRPTLHWEPVPGSPGTQVEVCLDRACSRVLRPLSSETGSVRVDPGLSPGVYFWRARAQAEWTPTWQFYVDGRDAEVDTSWGTRQDVNGDGAEDVAVPIRLIDDAVLHGSVEPHPYGFEWIYGSPSGPVVDHRTRFVVADPDHVEFGIGLGAFYPAGDFDGDGFLDVMLLEFPAGSNPDPTRYRWNVVRGGPDPALVPSLLALAPPCTGNIPVAPQANPGALDPVTGDVNADGYVDVVVSGYDHSNACAAFVYLGSPQGFVPQHRQLQLLDATPSAVYFPLGDIADVNGDGFGDAVVVGSGSDGGDAGTYTVGLYFGRSDGFAANPDVIVPCASCQSRPNPQAVLFDTDASGHADVMVFTADQSAFYAEVTPWGGTSPGPSRVVTIAEPGGTFAAMDDIDRDGTEDVIWLERDSQYQYAGSRVSFGFFAQGRAPRSITFATDLVGQPTPPNLGYGPTPAGDLDGNGAVEIAMPVWDSASRAQTGWNVYQNLGTAFSPTPAWTLPDEVNGDGT